MNYPDSDPATVLSSEVDDGSGKALASGQSSNSVLTAAWVSSYVNTG